MVQLDGLRGIAAIAVMLYHVQNIFGIRFGFDRAYLFVDMFFLLSGFVLTLTWRADATGPAFFVRRVIRLWPTIAGATVIGAAVYAMIGDGRHLATLLFMGFMCTPLLRQPGEAFPLNSPQWSLSWELLANLAHGLLLCRLSTRQLGVAAAAMGVGLTTAILTYGGNTFGPDGTNWTLGLFRVGWSYTLGMCLARLYVTGKWRPTISWRVALSLTVSVAIALPAMSHSRGIDVIFVVVLMPALFWLLAISDPPVNAASGVLSVLGAISFPLYAVHLPILRLFAHHSTSPQVAAAAISIALLTATIITVATAFKRLGSRDIRLRFREGAPLKR